MLLADVTLAVFRGRQAVEQARLNLEEALRVLERTNAALARQGLLLRRLTMGEVRFAPQPEGAAQRSVKVSMSSSRCLDTLTRHDDALLAPEHGCAAARGEPRDRQHGLAGPASENARGSGERYFGPAPFVCRAAGKCPTSTRRSTNTYVHTPDAFNASDVKRFSRGPRSVWSSPACKT
jgi:hypothetical protein